jgi:diaminohydroxyphosphoribosylaminopyrimidine deaminase/5-amino-6-(5-phosphoribosylamino)uracil reductase
MTQRGARRHFQASLAGRGVEVVEFDFLTPEAVADYCYERGFLQVCVCVCDTHTAALVAAACVCVGGGGGGGGGLVV